MIFPKQLQIFAYYDIINRNESIIREGWTGTMDWKYLFEKKILARGRDYYKRLYDYLSRLYVSGLSEINSR